MRARTTLLVVSQAALLAGALCAAALVSDAEQWQPAGLVVVLFLIAIGIDLVAVQAKTLRLSGSFMALVLAMALLGPAPAAAIGVASMAIDGLRTRPPLPYLLNNLATYATFPLVGGLILHDVGMQLEANTEDATFSILLFATFMLVNALNFVMVAGASCVMEGGSLLERTRTMFLPVLPSELLTGLLTVAVAHLYARAGTEALVLVALVLVIFQYLLRELLRSQERGEELERRGRQLASLQMGVLAGMVRTLSLRDRMTARHSAAVARYSREIARAAGLSEADQELVHTAGLLHDIGKFIFPDSILLADRRLTDEDWEIVKRHPAQGADVVRNIDGYGPVAEIILNHHERIDGAGYPNGVSGTDIPIGSRIISVADAYDVMTARDSYRSPIAPSEAIAELRRCAGAHFDAELVEVFTSLLESKGVGFRHADDADFEAELGFERRVAAHAEPRAVAAA